MSLNGPVYLPQDVFAKVKAVCTCPRCATIWPHREAGGVRTAGYDVMARYHGVVRCDACGTWSRLEMRGRWRTPRRVPCPAPTRPEPER